MSSFNQQQSNVNVRIGGAMSSLNRSKEGLVEASIYNNQNIPNRLTTGLAISLQLVSSTKRKTMCIPYTTTIFLQPPSIIRTRWYPLEIQGMLVKAHKRSHLSQILPRRQWDHQARDSSSKGRWTCISRIKGLRPGGEETQRSSRGWCQREAKHQVSKDLAWSKMESLALQRGITTRKIRSKLFPFCNKMRSIKFPTRAW